MTDQHKKWFRYFLYALLVFFVYVGLVYTYFQFETFSSSQSDPSFVQTIWYVVLNPTGLGNSGNFMNLPSSFVGKVIAIIFTITGLGLMGVFIGKIGDMFNEYREYHRLGHSGTDFEDHMVVIGWNDFTRLVTRELIRSDRKVAVITTNRESIDLIYDQFGKDSVFVLFTELKNYEMFDKANLNKAKRVLVSPRGDTDTLVTLLNIKDLYSKPDYVVTIENEELTDTFEEEFEDEDGNKRQLALYAVPPYETACGLIASNIFEPDAAEYIDDLITSVPEEPNGDERHELQEFQITRDHQFNGETYGEVFEYLYEEFKCPPIGLSKTRNNDGSNRDLIKLPEDDINVEAGDYVVLIVSSNNVDQLQKFFGVTQGLNL